MTPPPRLSPLRARLALFTAGAAALAGFPAAAAPLRPPIVDVAPEAFEARRRQLVEDLTALRFDRLGDPVHRRDAIAPVYAPAEHPHALLVVLVEFSDRGFERFAPGSPEAGDPARRGERLAGHFQASLFDPDYARPGTLSAYYRAQSLGTYHVQGRVLPPVRLSKPRAAYGAPVRPEGGDWRNDADPEGLVEEAVALLSAAHPDLPTETFDRWDPTDFDGDGLRDEGDGYVDHLLFVFAGADQSSCHLLHRLDLRLDKNALPGAAAQLPADARECAERLWAHRFALERNVGQGPVIEGRTHARGGLPLREIPGLWAVDYTMQSEYAEPATFAHEFAHSLGLPDIYARSTQNSTGPWDLMSDAAAPLPQNLSAWSRMMLGWLRPRVLVPPEFGGAKVQSMYLRTLDAPLEPAAVARAKQAEGLYRAALVVLPPRVQDLELTDLPAGNGRMALYSGQGNRLDRSAEFRVDLRGDKPPKRVELSFDAWWEIEAGWDFAYLETSTDAGRTWARRRPTDPRLMPARHGHDGPTSLPGFTGVSGDLDADGKNESHPGCDPAQALATGEDKARVVINQCRVPTWVRPAFDLTDLAGRNLRVRLRYVTDLAAVQRGVLIDDVRVTRDGATELTEGFEGDAGRGWRLNGFLPSPGHHALLVPQYYLLEFRDPEVRTGGDAPLAAPLPRFYADPRTGEMRAITVRPMPGVVAWYFDGAYAWAENDPVDNGQGRGFLLAVDAHPNELALPGFEPFLAGRAEQFDTRYDLEAPERQAALRESFLRTMCFVRPARYRPVDLFGPGGPLRCPDTSAPLDGFQFIDGRALRSLYAVNNELLPGSAREAVLRAGDLLDHKTGRDGRTTWRLRDRTLRALHLADAPFALENPGDRAGITTWRLDAETRRMVEVSHAPFKPVARFSDAERGRWLDPYLFFGGVDVPREGMSFELARPKPDAPEGARVKVWVTWER